MSFTPPSSAECDLALKLLDVHQAFYEDDYRSAVFAAMSASFPGIHSTRIGLRNYTTRAYIYGIQGDTLIIVNEGIQPYQFPIVAGLARNMSETPYGWYAQPAPWHDCQLLYNEISSRSSLRWQKMFVSGYSLGAAIVQLFAAIYSSRGLPTSQIKIRNFSGPKPGNLQMTTKLYGADIIRWQLFGDFVPLIPVDQTIINYLRQDHPEWTNIFTDAALGDNYLYKHPPGGVVLTETGFAQEYVNATQLASWARGCGILWYNLFGGLGNLPASVFSDKWFGGEFGNCVEKHKPSSMRAMIRVYKSHAETAEFNAQNRQTRPDNLYIDIPDTSGGDWGSQEVFVPPQEFLHNFEYGIDEHQVGEPPAPPVQFFPTPMETNLPTGNAPPLPPPFVPQQFLEEWGSDGYDGEADAEYLAWRNQQPTNEGDENRVNGAYLNQDLLGDGAVFPQLNNSVMPPVIFQSVKPVQTPPLFIPAPTQAPVPTNMVVQPAFDPLAIAGPFPHKHKHRKHRRRH